MRVLIAPNAFKGSIGAASAAARIARGIRRVAPGARLDLMPISDGGDGLIEVLLARFGGKTIVRKVVGPLGRPRRASYAVLMDGRTAVIEMARASGIAGLRRLDPLRATSYGTGELIRDALGRGARRILVGMGGSATNDGGAGMAEALGARFLDSDGRVLPRGVAALRRLARVDASGMDFKRSGPGGRASGVSVWAVSDVRNPLLGPVGSARVYGPQKGATPAMVREMERALRRYARVLARDLGVDVARMSGAGAAGGLGAGLAAFLRAKIVPGADWVLDRLRADRRLLGADWVITGEGRFDRQSFFGKAPVALALRARSQRIPVTFICGQVDPRVSSRARSIGVRDAYCLAEPGENPARAMKNAGRRLQSAARLAAREFLMDAR